MGKYLSDEQLAQQMFLSRGCIFMEDASRIAVAAVDNYQKYLALGEKRPCGNCKDSYRLMKCQDTCEHYTSWLDRQEGYALGLQERDKLWADIVEHFDWPMGCYERFLQWLNSKGMTE